MKVIEHSYERWGYNLYHTAKVEKVEGVTKDDPEMAVEVAIKVGYHPGGYGLWEPKMKEIENGVFQVSWKSQTHCD